ncbi:MAG: hypothetical protein V8R81_06515 [Clostridia bacterium]
MKNHLTLGIYPDHSYKYNVVRDEDLEEHIIYNQAFRPGRLLYIDGKRIYNGLIKQEFLAEYDEIAKKFYENVSKINMNILTIPYR